MALLLEPQTWPQWQSEIDAVDQSGPLAEGDTVTGRARMLGFVVQGSSRATSITTGGFEEDAVVGLRMRIRYTLEEDGDGVVVTHNLETDLPEGLAGRLLSLFLRRRLKRMQSESLADLVAQSETAARS